MVLSDYSYKRLLTLRDVLWVFFFLSSDSSDSWKFSAWLRESIEMIILFVVIKAKRTIKYVCREVMVIPGLNS